MDFSPPGQMSGREPSRTRQEVQGGSGQRWGRVLGRGVWSQDPGVGHPPSPLVALGPTAPQSLLGSRACVQGPVQGCPRLGLSLGCLVCADQFPTCDFPSLSLQEMSRHTWVCREHTACTIVVGSLQFTHSLRVTTLTQTNTGCGGGIPRVEFKPIWGQQVASTKHVVWTSAFWGFLLSKAGRSQ